MNTKSITRIAILTAVFSVVSAMVIPFGLVPISLSTLFLCIFSTLLKPKEIIISMILYLFIGIIGIPVFAGFQAGFSVIIGPTGGYLIGYVFAGFIMSLINFKISNKWIWPVSFLIGILITYVFGTFHFMLVMNWTFKESIVITIYQFIVGDIIELIIAFIISIVLKKLFTKYQ